MLRTILSSLFVLSFGLQASAQSCGAHASDAISTDRPQVTNSSVVVPCGSLQFENGFQQTGSGGRQGFDLPETAVRFGITNNTELRLAVPDYFQNDDTNPGFANGANDMVIGLKQHFGPVHGIDVSVIPSISLPTGSGQISSHGYDPSVQVPWAHALTKVWSVAGQLALFDPTQGTQRNLTGQASVYFDRSLNPLWDLYLEYSGEFPQRGSPQHTVDFGAEYKISPHQQLDLHANFGFAAALPAHAIGIGYSVRFQVIRAKKS
jgi:hypothetical protein